MSDYHYEVLGLPVDASQEDVDRRYHDLVRALHPDIPGDVNAAPDRLVRVNRAYRTLGDPARRKDYDDSRRRIPSSGTSEESWPSGLLSSIRYASPGRETDNTGVCCNLLISPKSLPNKAHGSTCNPNCQLRRARNAFEKGDDAAAWEYCAAHLSLNPSSQAALELLGDVYDRQGYVESAISTYHEALKLAPLDTRVQSKLRCLNTSTVVRTGGHAPTDAGKSLPSEHTEQGAVTSPKHDSFAIRFVDTVKAALHVNKERGASLHSGLNQGGGHSGIQQPSKTAGPASGAKGEHASNGLNILLVDDNPVLHTAITRLLQAHGFTVSVASNGEEALAALHQKRFDLVLMDVMMPVMDGLSATRAIRDQESNAATRVPIIALTALEGAGDRERCLDAGMDFYIEKPVGIKELLDVIKCFLPESALALNSTSRTQIGY